MTSTTNTPGHCEACGGRGEIDVSSPYSPNAIWADCLTCDCTGLAPGYARCRCGEGVYNPDEESKCVECVEQGRMEHEEDERERRTELARDAYEADAFDRAGDR